MKVIIIEDRDGTVGRVVARFALGDDRLEPGDEMLPEVGVLLDVRASLGDYIKAEGEKVTKAMSEAEKQALLDAELLEGVRSVEEATLAAAEATAAHTAAWKKNADKAVEEAKKNVEKTEKAAKS